MMNDRTKVLRLLWSATRRIPDGEETLRAAVTAANDRDATNADQKGTPEYSSTKLLSYEQLLEIATRFRVSSGLPAPPRRKRGPKGGRPARPSTEPGSVVYLSSQGERDYARYLFVELGFDDAGRASFTARQTKGAGLTTHKDCNAVILPLERIAKARGYTIVVEAGGEKRLVAPTEAR